MDLSNLTPKKGSVKNKKRIARGEASGSGGTAGRGHKGQKSRSGYSKNWFWRRANAFTKESSKVWFCKS